jgi:hypothetical protein
LDLLSSVSFLETLFDSYEWIRKIVNGFLRLFDHGGCMYFLSDVLSIKGMLVGILILQMVLLQGGWRGEILCPILGVDVRSWVKIETQWNQIISPKII